MSADLSRQEAAIKAVIAEWERTCEVPYAKVSQNRATNMVYDELRLRGLVPKGEKTEAEVKKAVGAAIEAWANSDMSLRERPPLGRSIYRALNNEGLFRMPKPKSGE